MRNDNLQILLLKPVFLKDSFLVGGEDQTLYSLFPLKTLPISCVSWTQNLSLYSIKYFVGRAGERVGWK